MEQLKQAKEKVYAEVAAYVFAHPGDTFERVAARFGMSCSTVSRIATRAGLAPRRPGRKPGSSGGAQ
jgi:hypothetical protein